MEWQIKDGVDITGLKPEMLLGFFMVSSVIQKYTAAGKPGVITSIIDGKHKRNSEHYQGNAMDFRIWYIAETARCVEEMKQAAGRNYFIQLESDHIHMHYEPQRIDD